jgi:hypothetical protein
MKGTALKTNFEIAKFTRFQRTGIKNIRGYEQSIRADYESIKAYLPEHCACIVDIGCGMAGIDILLFKHYQKRCDLCLVDKDGISENLYYGFQNEAAHYNSLAVTREFLILNQVNPVNIFTYDVNKNEFPTIRAQLVLSLISCGFHYPVSTYLDRIKALCCPPGYSARPLLAGTVILDIRKGTDQLAILKDSFTSVIKIADFAKFERMAMR